MEEYGELVAEVKKDQRSVVLGMETTVKEMVRAFENCDYNKDGEISGKELYCY